MLNRPRLFIRRGRVQASGEQNDRLLPLHTLQPLQNFRNTRRQIQRAESQIETQLPECRSRRLFVRAEIQDRLRRFRVFHNRNSIARRQTLKQRVRGPHVPALQQINRGSRFDQQQNLRRLLNRGKASERLLDPVIKNVKIFATQAFHEVPARIGDNHSNADAINAHANRWGVLLL